VNDAASIEARLAHEVGANRLEADPAQQGAARRLDALAVRLNAQPAPGWFRMRASTGAASGIYLWGSVGRGKTLLMDLFFDSLRFAQRERRHFYQFMQTVHAELRASAGRERPLEDVAARLAERSRVICLDEFLVLDIADAMILAGLLDGLLRRGVSLVATSNRPPRDLYKDGLQRQRFLPAIDLLERRLEVLELGGDTDYRQRSLQAGRTYWPSDAPGSESELERLFGLACGANRSGPTSLTVQGRPIAARDSGADAAWFEFAALCATTRNAADYLELSQRYRTLVVSHVPRFRSEDDDAARRFLTLIDALYDRGRRIVLSAAAEPADLYHGERLRFEFERAASRLVEMRSQRYLAEHPPP
jgi:cell division protein ZapE